MKYYAMTDVGRRREMNQDYVYAMGQPIGPFPNLLVVADGMGGHKAGDFASKFTVEVVKREIAGSRSRKPEKVLRDAIQVANRELIRVASKYPGIAKDYFYNKKHQTVEIIKLHGSVELAPIVGLSEVIVDIVETGTTLKENGLEVLEEICPLSARVVVNQVSMKMENERIMKLIRDIKTVI